MTAVDVRLNLPDDVADEARQNGLLTPEAIERLLRSELKKRSIEALFETADRLAALGNPMTEAEIEAEIEAARKERRARQSRSH